jgi:hypothetical protein
MRPLMRERIVNSSTRLVGRGLLISTYRRAIQDCRVYLVEVL